MADYRFPNWPVIPTKPAVFDDRSLLSTYMAKCKRRRSDGPTPCYCCPGECVGEPRSAAEDALYSRDALLRLDAARKPDCPWAWSSTIAVTLFIIVMYLGKGVIH